MPAFPRNEPANPTEYIGERPEMNSQRREVNEGQNSERKFDKMKPKIVSKMFVSLGLVFVLGSAITQMHGGSLASSEEEQMPVITVHSADNVYRGKTGSFVLNMSPPVLLGGTYVNFSVSGTAVPGVDYVPLVSPASIAPAVRLSE